MPGRGDKRKTSFTLTPEGLRLLAELSERLGVSQSAVLELAIREYAHSRGVRAKEDRGDGR